MSRRPRVWFIRPQWHWFGPATLLPFYRGQDEWLRVTVVLGWTVTGRVVIALWRDWYADIPTPIRRPTMSHGFHRWTKHPGGKVAAACECGWQSAPMWRTTANVEAQLRALRRHVTSTWQPRDIEADRA